ncbi:MAG: hypothetical protein GVY25_01745 [Bacteroidetes bacterium]|jgi:hypothetical protein|nr:hypothetical protein [Bacteroidota bacterium]
MPSLPDIIDDAWSRVRREQAGPVLESHVSGTFARVMSYVEIASALVIVLFGVLFDVEFIGSPFYLAGATAGVVIAYVVLWDRYTAARATQARAGQRLLRVDAEGITLYPSDEVERTATVRIPWDWVRGVRTLDVPHQRGASSRYDLYCGFDLLTPDMTEALAWERFDEVFLVEDLEAESGTPLPDLPAYALSVLVNVDSTQQWTLNGDSLPLETGDLYEQVPALFRRFEETSGPSGAVQRLTGRWWLSPERAAHTPSDYMDDRRRTFDGDDPWKYVNAARYPFDEIAEDELVGAAREGDEDANVLARPSHPSEDAERHRKGGSSMEFDDPPNGQRNTPGRDLRGPEDTK